MLTELFLAWCMLAFCVSLHALGLASAFRWLKNHSGAIGTGLWPSTRLLIQIAAWVILLHGLQIAAWAFAYFEIGAFPDLRTAFYFSAVTYTTTGYGDVLLPHEWRLFGSVEALIGILMCGVSTGFFFAAFAKLFGLRSESGAT